MSEELPSASELTPAQQALRDAAPQPMDPQTALLEENFQRLCELVAINMSPEKASAYFNLFTQFAEDQTYLGVTYLGLVRAPSARGNHHAFEGGLIFHYLEMWRVWTALRKGLTHLVPKTPEQIEEDRKENKNDSGTWASDLLVPPYLSDERVLQGIINHDIHKAYCTYVQVPGEPWAVRYGEHETSSLMNSTMKSTWMLVSASGVLLDVEQLHALGASEGGWSDQKNVPHTSVLAKLLYVLDEMSANVLGRIGAGTLLERHREVRPRYMSLPQEPEEPEEET